MKVHLNNDYGPSFLIVHDVSIDPACDVASPAILLMFPVIYQKNCADEKLAHTSSLFRLACIVGAGLVGTVDERQSIIGIARPQIKHLLSVSQVSGITVSGDNDTTFG